MQHANELQEQATSLMQRQDAMIQKLEADVRDLRTRLIACSEPAMPEEAGYHQDCPSGSAQTQQSDIVAASLSDAGVTRADDDDQPWQQVHEQHHESRLELKRQSREARMAQLQGFQISSAKL